MAEAERNLGEQPIAGIMENLNLGAGDLVAASGEQISYKMVKRACKGRRLNPRVQQKILRALNRAADKSYQTRDLFNY